MNSTTTILVVDDSRVSRMMSRAFILNKHPEWKIEEAGTGEEAIEKMSQIVPALVLMDVNMPAHGRHCCRRNIARAISFTNRSRCKRPTFRRPCATKQAAIGAGFLEKPINEARIHKLLVDLGVG